MSFSHALSARLSAAPTDRTDGPRLQGYLAGMLRGLETGHASRDACRRRISGAFDRLVGTLGRRDPTWGDFYTALVTTIDDSGEAGFFLRDEPLRQDLDLRAVTFQCAIEPALRAWMDGPATAASLARAVKMGTTRPGAQVGRPGRATWLTPLKGAVADLIDGARAAPSANAAWEARNIVAASWWDRDWVVVAMITRQPIRDLSFRAPDKDGRTRQIGLVGSTVIEAREHKHFRHWPPPTEPSDPYGRTYHFDPGARRSAHPALSYGIPEAVRTPIALDRFNDCVVIGKLTDRACTTREPDSDFLQAVGGDRSPADLLHDVMRRL